jgi:integrase
VNDYVRRGKLHKSHLNGIDLDVIPSKDDEGSEAEFIFPDYAQLTVMSAGMPAEYRLAIWLMRGCGLRLGEALGVSAADFTPGMLRVREQLRPDGKSYGPLKRRKAGEYRDVPVPAYVQEMVDSHTPQADGRLFAPMTHNRFRTRFNRSRDVAGIPASFTPHSLRHVFASVALSNSVPITDVSKWLGHRNINTTYAIYGHLVPSSWDRARSVLDTEYDAWSKPQDEAA